MDPGKAARDNGGDNPDEEYPPPSTCGRKAYCQYIRIFGAQAFLSKPYHAAVRRMVRADLQKICSKDTSGKRTLRCFEEAEGKGGCRG